MSPVSDEQHLKEKLFETTRELVDAPELLQESLWGAQRITELESTLKIVGGELKYKCEVSRDFQPLPPIRCHPTQLAQVFTSLLLNAVQAIETRGQIHILTRHENAEVVVRISDTGKGMTPETLAKLSTPFFTTKPRGQGTGLGLSISYSIIARHKGRIEVQREPGKGTTFTIRLPAQAE